MRVISLSPHPTPHTRRRTHHILSPYDARTHPHTHHTLTHFLCSGYRVDMMDYDANLIAVAVGAASPEQAAKVLARVDRGPCTHSSGTWGSHLAHTHTSQPRT